MPATRTKTQAQKNLVELDEYLIRKILEKAPARKNKLTHGDTKKIPAGFCPAVLRFISPELGQDTRIVTQPARDCKCRKTNRGEPKILMVEMMSPLSF